MVDLATEGHFRNPFRSCEWGYCATKWHSCAKGVFRSCETPYEIGLRAAKHPAKWGFGCENWIFYALGISQPFQSHEIGVGGCEMALVCQEVVSQLRKFSQRGAWGYEMIFAAKCRFRNGLFGVVKSFRSKVAISQQTPLGCEISQAKTFPLLLNSFLLQATFL